MAKFVPVVRLNRGFNGLNLSHQDMRQIHELSQQHKSLKDAVDHMKVLWRLLDNNVLPDEECYSSTWSIAKEDWTQVFDHMIDGCESVNDALTYTLKHFESENEDDVEGLQPLTVAERDLYLKWFDEIKLDDPTFDFHYLDLDEVTQQPNQ